MAKWKGIQRKLKYYISKDKSLLCRTNDALVWQVMFRHNIGYWQDTELFQTLVQWIQSKALIEVSEAEMMLELL
jgi:hypothetical protein